MNKLERDKLLQSFYKKIYEDVAATPSPKIIELFKYVDRLEDALKFYANGGNFSQDVWLHPDLGYFTGKRARQALEGGE